MSELTDFLKARIAEDEATAKEAASRSAAVTGSSSSKEWPGQLAPGPAGDGTVVAQPQRILAECSAKLKLVDYLGLDAGLSNAVESTPLRDGDAETATLQLLALPYAEHPDYRANWRVI